MGERLLTDAFDLPFDVPFTAPGARKNARDPFLAPSSSKRQKSQQETDGFTQVAGWLGGFFGFWGTNFLQSLAATSGALQRGTVPNVLGTHKLLGFPSSGFIRAGSACL